MSKLIKTVTLDGESYSVNCYSTTFGMKLLVRIFRLAGEPLVGVAALAMDKKRIDLEVTPELLQGLVRGLLDRLDPEVSDTLIKDILSETFSGPTKVTSDYDTRFQGKFGHLFKLVGKTLEAQYGDFSSALAALKGK